MTIETIRLSEKEKTQLITLKRRTGIQNWNVLCRWAFALSLAEPSVLPDEDIPSDSSVEMTWKTFGGPHADLYLALLRQRAHQDNVTISAEEEPQYFRQHLHRGISYLTSSVSNNINSLLLLACKNT